MRVIMTDDIVISDKVASYLVAAIEEAVGDDIKRDVRSNHLVTQNSTPSRIWDFINTSIAEDASDNECLVSITQRGPWNMVVLYDTESKYVITIMREERLSEISRTLNRRKSLHYLQAFTRCYNKDLYASGKQISMSEEENALNDAYEEAEEIVQKMLESVHSTEKLTIERHVLVLFGATNFQLTNIRAVMIDTDLDIVCEKSWNKYISASESIVADVVDHTIDDAAYNSPTHGLKFKAKAMERKAPHSKIKEQSKESIKKA